MQNFTYWNPVKIVFGKETIKELPNLISSERKVLVIYGGGSIKKNGVYEQVTEALKGYHLYEFAGIEPNPLYETCMEAVKIVKEKDIDFLLAVGGGSVLDATKFISLASKFEGEDPWDILIKFSDVDGAIPLGCVLTLPATGSEMNCGAVISNKKTKEKYTLFNLLVFPLFSIIDPETGYSLPDKQIINGIVDTFIHVLEQYITYDENSPLQDRQAEAILNTIMEIAPLALQNKTDYNIRANLCWCATHALNGIISCGVPQDWCTHMIGHELTAIYGIDHAQSLAVILPRLWESQKNNKSIKLKQYAKRVLNLSAENDSILIDQAIKRTEEFFKNIGMKTKLIEYDIKPEEAALKIYNRFKKSNYKLGENGNIDADIIKEIVLKS